MCRMSFEGGNNQDSKKESLEGIQCAAVKYKDEIFTGRVHADAWLLMTEKYPEVINNPEGRIDGFLTTNNRFVEREEALGIAEAADELVSDMRYSVNGLISEDLKKNQD